MALKSDANREEGPDLEDVLEALDKQVERLKVMYEQYFLGIQKLAPAQLHRDVEREVRELTQAQIRNTGMRYRFTMISQRYGAYNSYWRRVLREIEQGRYIRDLGRVGRKARRQGEEIPEEILAKMPKLMRERVQRERDRQAARLADSAPVAGTAAPSPAAAAPTRASSPRGVHAIDDLDMLDNDLDLDSMFDAITTGVDHQPAPLPQASRDSGLNAKPAAPAASSAPPMKPTGGPPLLPPPPLPDRDPTAASPQTPARPLTAPPRPSTQVPRAPTLPPRAATNPPRAATSPVAAAPPPGMTEAQTRDLHKRYVEARKLVGESDDLPYERLLGTLNKQASQIMQAHAATGVEFRVVVKDNTVVLKAKPQK